MSKLLTNMQRTEGKLLNSFDLLNISFKKLKSCIVKFVSDCVIKFADAIPVRKNLNAAPKPEKMSFPFSG